jgi:hypothetical protein
MTQKIAVETIGFDFILLLMSLLKLKFPYENNNVCCNWNHNAKYGLLLRFSAKKSSKKSAIQTS